MFDGASNVQLAGRLLKVYYTRLTVVLSVEHTLYLFSLYLFSTMILKYPLYIK